MKLRPYAKRSIKTVIDWYFAGKVALLRMAGVVDYPVPPNHNIRTTSSKTLRHYYSTGLTTALPIATAAMSHGLDLRSPLNVLDFGCGAGRQLVHFTRQFSTCRYFACDVNFDAMKFIARGYPQVDSYANDFDPPLKWAADTFDMIYSVSIFSHLSPPDRDLWMAELYRVTKPGRLCLLTFNGLHSLRRWTPAGASLDAAEKKLEEEGVIFESCPEQLEAQKAEDAILKDKAPRIGIKRIYGDTYHSVRHAEEVFCRPGFQSCGVLKGIIDNTQDLIVLRKPTNLPHD